MVGSIVAATEAEVGLEDRTEVAEGSGATIIGSKDNLIRPPMIEKDLVFNYVDIILLGNAIETTAGK